MKNLLCLCLASLLFLVACSQKIRLPSDGNEIDVARFGIIPNSTEDQSDQISMLAKQALWQRKVLYFPAGRYVMSRPIIELKADQSFSVRGAGKGKTILTLKPGSSGPLLVARGGYKISNGGGNAHVHLRGLSFDGLGANATALFLQRVSMSDFEDLSFHSFNEAAIRGVGFSDSLFRKVDFVGCGNFSRQIPAVLLSQIPTQGAVEEGEVRLDEKSRSCNNLIFRGGRFEDSNFTSLAMTQGARKILVKGTYFRHTPNVTYPHIAMREGNNNIITNSEFVGGSLNGIRLNDSYSTILSYNLFSSTLRQAISLENTTLINVISNRFASASRDAHIVERASRHTFYFDNGQGTQIPGNDKQGANLQAQILAAWTRPIDLNPLLDVTEHGVKANLPDDQSAQISLLASRAVSEQRVLYFPPGFYIVKRPIADIRSGEQLIMRGASMGATQIHFLSQNGSALIEANGELSPANLELRDITLAGIHPDDPWNVDPANDLRTEGDALFLKGVANSIVENVTIRHFKGSAFQGDRLHTIIFSHVHFIQSGNAARALPMVAIRQSQELTFRSCRLEANHYVAFRVRGSNRIMVDGSKFHGMLPKAAPYDTIQLFDSTENYFSHLNVTNGGANGFYLENSPGNFIRENRISGSLQYGVNLRNSPGNIVKFNLLNVEHASNGLGALSVEGSAESVVMGNQLRPLCSQVVGSYEVPCIKD